MATKTIDAGNIYVTDGSISGNVITTGEIIPGVNQKVVRITTTKIDYNYDNNVVQLPIPVSTGDRLIKTPFSRAMELKVIKEVISVQGFLADEETESAITKRDNLLTLGKQRDELTVVWGVSPYQTLWKRGTSPYGAFILKMMFTETAGIVGEPVSGNPQPERNIAIQIQLARGKDLKTIS